MVLHSTETHFVEHNYDAIHTVIHPVSCDTSKMVTCSSNRETFPIYISKIVRQCFGPLLVLGHVLWLHISHNFQPLCAYFISKRKRSTHAFVMYQILVCGVGMGVCAFISALVSFRVCYNRMELKRDN